MMLLFRLCFFLGGLLSAVSAALAGETLPPGVLWQEDFETIQLGPKATTDTWRVGDPPRVSMTVKDSVLSLAEIGAKSWGAVGRYVPFDLVSGGQGFPYLQIKLEDAPGRISVGNASTNGQRFTAGLRGPGLYSVDLRLTTLRGAEKPGLFYLALTSFGPNGHKPGPVVRIDWMRMTSKSEDNIEVILEDGQKKGEAGFGYVSVGDKLRFEVITSVQYEEMSFAVVDGETGKEVNIDGRTRFPARNDQDRKGFAWSAEITVTAKSDHTLKTWRLRQGKIQPGNQRLTVVAYLKGGKYRRLSGYMPYGFDLTAGKSGAGITDPMKLLQGAVLLENDFNQPGKDDWRFIAGQEWVFLRQRFGDLSDSKGPDGFGNWAQAGASWWQDYRFSAEMAEELDGAGSVFLAVRFQDPGNYYALEWKTAGRTDVLQLVRCKDGTRYVIAKSEGHKLDNFPFKLAVAVSGDALTGYLNDQPVVMGYASDFSAGPVALGEMNRKVLVDNVKVTRIVSKPKLSRFHRQLRLKYTLKPRYFLRDTGKLELPFVISNTGKQPFEQVYVRIRLEPLTGQGWYKEKPDNLMPPLEANFARVESGARVSIAYPLDTRMLKSGEYVLRTLIAIPREGLAREEAVYLGIARNWNPERFNYFTWGLPGKEEGLADYARHGHTTGISGGRATPLAWAYNGKPIPEAARPKKRGVRKVQALFDRLDLALKYGIIAGSNLQSNHGQFFPDEVYGKNNQGKRTRLPLPYHPRFHEFSVNFARTYAQTYGAYPAYRLMNINTETEYHNHPDYSEIGLAKARKEFGAPPPAGCESMFAFPHTAVPGLAQAGVIDDGHPILKFYRWFWRRGEGFNTLALDMAKAVRQVVPDMIVFHDPAERMPFFRDRHDGVNPWDWTYTTPNALTVPFKHEILFALAEPANPRVVNYVQVLWKKGVASDKNECPSATIIRLGLLYSASRPVYAVGHWNTNWMTQPQNRDRWEGVKNLHERFWKPVGPVLMNLKRNLRREVAFLVSHTNSLFAVKHRGYWQMSYAYAAWHEAFMRASLPVDIVFEEDVAEGKLSQYTKLFIPFGEVISKKAYEQIRQFVEKGGLVVADHNLGYQIPKVKILQANMDHVIYPNWAFMRVRTEGQGIRAPERIEKMWTATDEIAAVFAAERAKVPTASDKWLIINQREGEGVPYIFAVNDKRSPGDQVGKYNVMWERGEPLRAAIIAPVAENVAAVYDLVAHRQVETKRTGGKLTWATDYAPASGTLFALLPQEIAKVDLTVSERVKKGELFTVSVRILDAKGDPVRGLIPIRLTVRDSQHALNEYSDTFAVKNGVWSKQGWIALNDKSGTWMVMLEDLASGRRASKYFTVLPRTMP